MACSALVIVGLYSLQAHKEPRFILPIAPIGEPHCHYIPQAAKALTAPAPRLSCSGNLRRARA